MGIPLLHYYTTIIPICYYDDTIIPLFIPIFYGKFQGFVNGLPLKTVQGFQGAEIWRQLFGQSTLS